MEKYAHSSQIADKADRGTFGALIDNVGGICIFAKVMRVKKEPFGV